MKNEILFERTKDKQELIKQFEKVLNQYKKIAVFRHTHPDYDAFGTQLGMEEFIKTNFPNTEVICVGDDHPTLTGRCFRTMDIIDDSWFNDEFLAIIVDCSQSSRIADERFAKAKFIVKIDHHPETDQYGNLQIVDISMAAAGELLASILYQFPKKYKISKECAANLYKAIVGDSGRFLYESTTYHTFELSKLLLQTGFSINQIYHEMYDQELSDLKVTSWVLNNYKITPHGVAYYVLHDSDLKQLGLPPQRGKENVNVFAHFNGIHAWMSVTEDVEKGEWRVSLRSADKSIEEVAIKYNGGGHSQASGCKLKDISELDNLLKDMDELFK